MMLEPSSRTCPRLIHCAAIVAGVGLTSSLVGCGTDGPLTTASPSLVVATTTSSASATDASGIPLDNYALTWGTNDCFVQPAFREEDVVIQANIPYVTVFDPKVQQNVTLALDMYSPPNVDVRSARPAIVLMHGGAFMYNSKLDDIPPWAKQVAARGYVVLSIDYRLASPEMFMLDPISVVARVQEDARAAVRFLRSKASDWRVDPGRVAVGGGSAGAVAALYYGFMPETGAPTADGEDTDPSAYSSAINGVISLAGTMKIQVFCREVDPLTYEPIGCALSREDFTDEIVAGDVPVVVVHGTGDSVVPYVNGRAVMRRAEEVGVRSKLLTAQGVGHMPGITNFLLNNETVRESVFTFISGMLNTAEADCPAQHLVV